MGKVKIITQKINDIGIVIMLENKQIFILNNLYRIKNYLIINIVILTQ
jgi:hypothetical protein